MSKINKINVENVSYDIQDKALTDKFFIGNQSQWDALSESQKNSFIFAQVSDSSYVELTENDVQNINDVLGENYEITSDLSEEDALEITNEIIEGSE